MDRSTFIIEQTFNRRLDEFVKFEVLATGNIKPQQLSENEEWIMKATLSVAFWANRAQRDDAAKTAWQVLISEMYREPLSLIPRLRMAVSDGDKSKVYELLGKLEAMMRGKP